MPVESAILALPTLMPAPTKHSRKSRTSPRKWLLIWRSEPFIPNDNVSFAADVPAEMATKLTDALVELASTEEGMTLLKDIGYQVQGLEKVDDTFYDEFRVSLQASGLDVTTLVK